jgi:hypothetical protein
MILTNNHVIYDATAKTPYPKVTVYFKPDRVTGNTKNDLKLGIKARVVARGPLLDSNSNLIGINTYVKRVNAQGLPLEGLNYSLRSELARRWLSGLGLRLAISDSPAAASPSMSGRSSGRSANGAHSAEPQRQASKQDGARSYRTRDGKSAFGVPNPDFNLEGTLAKVVSKAKKNASAVFDELDDMSMDLDEDGF